MTNIMKKTFVCLAFVASYACSGVFGAVSPQKILPPAVTDFEVRRNPALSGKCAVFYIDDMIWLFRDLARHQPARLFDNPFLKVLKEALDHGGLMDTSVKGEFELPITGWLSITAYVAYYDYLFDANMRDGARAHNAEWGNADRYRYSWNVVGGVALTATF